ncbi:MAG TPA: molybdopterin cofactor-binding domain-containing protein, partial [Stellaceae bacterium]
MELSPRAARYHPPGALSSSIARSRASISDCVLYETGTFAPDDNTYPNGCHVCEVEIDSDTGSLQIVRYVVVDDVGTVVNPIGLKGQIHGGVAQGLGQALMEQVVHDRDSGQNLTGSFMDYCMPRADTMPHMEITSNPVPTKRNPLGAKGAG